MKDRILTHPRYAAVLLGLVLSLLVVGVAWAAGNISATDKWAWSTNAGWGNFNPDNGGVTVYPDHLEGYAWGENIGWIRFNGTARNSATYKVATVGPLAVTLADFSAVQQGDAVLVTWETNSELENRGFNLYRGTSAAGSDRQLNTTLIPSQSQGNPGGFIYTWEDRADLAPGTTYFYWVEDVNIYGAATRHGPVSVDFSVPTAVEMVELVAGGGRTGLAAWQVLLAALLATLGGLAWRRRRQQAVH